MAGHPRMALATKMLKALLQKRLDRIHNPQELEGVAEWLARLLIGVENKLYQVKGPGYHDAPTGEDWELLRLTNQVEGRLRQAWFESAGADLPSLLSFDGREKLRRFILRDETPWSSIGFSKEDGIPGMLSDEEIQYYLYLGKFYSGAGEVVELGPWLGRSTHYIFQGLRDNPHFSDRQIYVFDAFIWYQYMDDWYPGDDKPMEDESFLHLFERYVRDIRDRLVVEQRKITDSGGNLELPALTWERGLIEICFVDCGPDFEVNEGWYQVLSSSFIPGKTLVVLQDWQQYKYLPVIPDVQIKRFSDSKVGSLELVHELSHGDIATFLFKGP